MPRHPLLLALPALALLSGCSTVEGWFGHEPPPRPQPVAPPPAPPPPAATQLNLAPPGLDGRYTGSLRLARDAARTCRPATIPASATVANGQVAMNLGRFGTAQGTIGSDAGANLSGTDLAGQAMFSGNRLSGQVQRGTCPYDLRLMKRAARG
jgi:hypothetical protein